MEIQYKQKHYENNALCFLLIGINRLRFFSVIRYIIIVNKYQYMYFVPGSRRKEDTKFINTISNKLCVKIFERYDKRFTINSSTLTLYVEFK